jgi:hypothetical protein
VNLHQKREGKVVRLNPCRIVDDEGEEPEPWIAANEQRCFGEYEVEDIGIFGPVGGVLLHWSEWRTAFEMNLRTLLALWLVSFFNE